MCVNSGLEAYMRKSTNEDISGKGGKKGGGGEGPGRQDCERREDL